MEREGPQGDRLIGVMDARAGIVDAEREVARAHRQVPVEGAPALDRALVQTAHVEASPNPPAPGEQAQGLEQAPHRHVWRRTLLPCRADLASDEPERAVLMIVVAG